MPPRRSILALLATIPAVMANSTNARHKKHKKRRKPVPPPPPPLGPCGDYGTGAVICGPYCCDSYEPVCCDYALDTNGKKCYDTTFRCCPIDFGGGACKLNETCCPPQKGNLVAACANTGLSDHCCAADSGGSCPATEDCCPSATTNSLNFGCCRVGRACCNVDADCDTAAGEVCGRFDGCCGPF